MQNNTFSTLFIGQNIIKLSSVDSTNNYLKVLLSKSEPLPEGTVIMAEEQYAGRGQQQNSWLATPGQNLTFSLFLKPVFLAIKDQFKLNMAISIALNEALLPLVGKGISIKWPNDIFFGDRKLGGILIENIISGQNFKFSIIGIGINVNQQDFQAELESRAISTRQILHKDVNRNELFAVICSQIESQFLKLKSNRNLLLTEAYLKKLYRFGVSSNFRCNGQVFEGSITGVTETGMLIIESGGKTEAYNFKEVEFII
ncbi:biotin--[acetyl-CoA-carboxylase] ligase [Pedobacter sp.]|uniref:biotin--[acetyl-CoA-carboxylase] ligase n=1 Tax=Pedobacter sp. TaxID=1411316 RepID=UPI003D7FA459